MLSDALVRSRKKLFGLAYRMTGSACDADDVVQEAYARALRNPPRDALSDPEPWLVTVTLNVARDSLRRRKRERYRGPWLPSPMDPNELEGDPPSLEDDGAEARYSRLESVSYAFMLALEALTPNERAVLLLRDVLDHDTEEVARMLGSNVGAVKVRLHRARKKLEGYERSRRPEACERSRDALVRLLAALRDEDPEALASLFAEDAVSLSDAGGEFVAAGIEVLGRERVVRVLLGLRKKGVLPSRFELRDLSGLPFFVAEQDPGEKRIAPAYAMACEVDTSGRIRALYTVMATRKLDRSGARLPPPTTTPEPSVTS
jgi:RNA polymerase sigma-70 factor (ECF subfamily)